MKKFFSFFAALLFAGSMMATEELKATLDFSTNEAWQFPADAKAIDAASYSDGTYTITLEGTTGNGYRWYSNGSYLLLGKQGATLTLPAFDWKTTKILVYGTSGASEAVKQNIFVGENAVSTETTGAKNVTNEYIIAEDYQEAGNVYAIKVTSAHNTQFSKIEIYGEGEGGGGETPVEPEMAYYVAGSMTNWGPMAAYKLAANPANEGEYMGEFTFAANDEFKVGYSDGTTIESTNYFPNGIDNNYVITEAGDYTVYFRPDGQGGEDWHYGCINAIKKEAPAAISCAAVYELAKDAEVALNDVTVTYVNGKNVWVKDETGAMLLYLSADATWAAGDVLSGVAGVVDIYKGLYEVKPNADQVAAVVATEGEAPAPEELAVVSDADVNRYILIKGVSAEGAFTEGTASNINITLGNAAYVLRNNFKNGYTFEAGKTYDVVALVSYYNALQLYFVSATEAEVTPIEPADEVVIYDWAGEIGTTILGTTGVEISTVKIHENTDDANGIKFGSSYVYADGKYIAIKPAEGGFKAGDKLSVAAVFNNANTDLDKYAQIDLRAADGNTRIWLSDSASTINGRLSAADPIVQTYTLEADQDSLLLGRYGNTAMFITFLQVAREAAAPIEPEVEEFYLVGNFNGWQALDAYKLAVNPANEAEMMIAGVELAAEDSLKVIGINGETVTWYPAGDETHNYVVAEAGKYVIYFRADGQGGEGWHEGVIFVEAYVEPVVEAISLTQFLTDKPAEEVLLKDLTVIYATNKSTYVIDEDGVALVMFDANKTYYDGTLAAGTVLSGQKATYTLYKGQDEIIPTNTAEAAQGELAVPVLMEDLPTVEANLNQYLRYDTVPVTENGGKYYLGTVVLYGASADLKPAEAGVYNVEGIFINYNSNTPELIVTGLEKIEGEKEAITLEFTVGVVSNEYYEEYGSTDLIFTNMEIGEDGYLVGDGDYMDISLFLEDPNSIAGTYTDENEGLDLEFTYLDRVNGTDTVEIGFTMGEVIIEVLDTDEEQSMVLLSIDATLIGDDDNAYVIEGTFVVLYDFIEDEPVEAVENTEAAAKVIKRIEMGNVVIYKNGEKYSVMGAKL